MCVNSIENYVMCVFCIFYRLPCGPCAPSRRPLIWKKITFEGEESTADPFSKEYKYRSKSLVLTNPQADLSTYYCYWKFDPDHELHFISSIWTVEVVPLKLLKRVWSRCVFVYSYYIANVLKLSAPFLNQKVTYRQWHRKIGSDDVALTSQPTRFSFDHGIQVGMQWGQWSDCSRCGDHVGKRHRLGFCSVTVNCILIPI